MADRLDPKQEAQVPRAWSTERILPEGFLPMLPTVASGPLDSTDHAYEVKWEGLRVLAGLEGAPYFLRTGTGQEAGFWFPELTQIRAAADPAWILLDGELVQLEGERASLVGLQRRLQARDAEAVSRLAADYPVQFMVYDILRIGDSWLLDVSWEERREILVRAVSETPAVRLAPIFAQSRDALARGARYGLEAVIAKRLRGRYTPGEKTRDWISIKSSELQEALICGWTEGRGSRLGTIGSLLLGVWREGKLVYVGHTGTGLDTQTLQNLHRELHARSRADCPFAEPPGLTAVPQWVRPELVCRVRHQGWSDLGQMRACTFVSVELPPTGVELIRSRSGQ